MIGIFKLGIRYSLQNLTGRSVIRYPLLIERERGKNRQNFDYCTYEMLKTSISCFYLFFLTLSQFSYFQLIVELPNEATKYFAAPGNEWAYGIQVYKKGRNFCNFTGLTFLGKFSWINSFTFFMSLQPLLPFPW